ncbi:MAG: type II secretion system F family protein [Candidatus Uhrbacteria bacterium]
MRFRYSAHTRAGKVIRGSVVAESQYTAERELAERGYIAVSIHEELRIVAFLRDSVLQVQRLPLKGIVIFLRQLSVMISAEMPLIDSLRALVRQTESPILRSVVIDIVKDVESGRRLSDAFAAHPRVFSSFAVYLIRAGETSGNLSPVVSYLADQAERDAELRSRIRGAMLYPAFIISGLVIVGFIMMTFVVPRTTQVLLQSGAVLPLSTQILIAVSGFLAAWWWLVIIATIVIFGGLRASLRKAAIRSRWDGLKLKLPVLGPIIRDVSVVRITQSFQMLLKGGVGIIPSLEVIRDVVSNAAYRDLIEATTREVMDGNSLTIRFRDSKLIPPMVTQLLAIGERSGKLEHVLEKLTWHYEHVVEQRIRNLITIIEPIVMIILGVGVGVTIAAVIMPMYSMVSQF